MPSRRSRQETGVSRRRALTVAGAALTTLAASLPVPGLGSVAGSTRSAARPPDVDEAKGPLARLHAGGVTGEGVDVAVLDPTGFDPNHRAISDHITALTWFGPRPRLPDGVSHGTAAAATVTRVAPDATLHLAGFDGDDGFARATRWARQRGVDVLFTPVAAHGVDAGGRSVVPRAARETVDAGVVVVAPTGNAARGHWMQPLDLTGGVAPDWSSRRISVDPLPGSDAVDGTLVAWVLHDGPPDLTLTLALVEATARGDGRNLIALSQPVRDGEANRLSATLDGGDYWLEVRYRGVGPPVDALTGVRVEVTTPTHRLSPSRPTGSIAVPAAEPRVLAVGALDATGTGAAPYSGRGPTVSGSVGVDLLAPPEPWIGPNDPGTSASAARAAGFTALVRGLFDGPPEAVMGVLRETAADLGGSRDGLATGAGRLDPAGAVQRARALDADGRSG